MNRRRRMLIPVAVVLAAVLLLIFPLPDPGFLPQRGDQDETVRLSFRNLSSDVTYTGDEECAVCHETIYRSFAETGMGRSFTRPDPEKTVEDFSGPPHVTDEKTRFHYEAVWQGTSLFQVEYRLNDEGERTHELRRKVDYVIGSGNGTRSYISEENGFLTEMPITWYNQKGIWDLSPGYHTTNLRFSRPIVAECMHCHNSFTGYVNYSENRYSDVPLGIGCERCHGPGELHVNWRLSKESDGYEGPDDSIVNPARLSPDLKMDVCRQCHLQGEVSVFRAGKTSLSFRPGMRLSDVKTVFIREGLPSGDFRIASHGARLSLSACFSQSGGQLVCTTCHDPHVPVKKVPRSAFNGTCTGCHDTGTLASVMDPGAHMAGGDCVQCHMRQGATSDILHVNFTDHWIRKDIQVLSKNETDSMMTLRPSVPVRLRDFFEQSDPEAGLRLGIAYVRFYEGRHGHPEYLRRAVTLLEEALRAGHTGPESKDAHYYLGIAFARQGKLELARREFQQGVELDPDNVFAQFQLGTVLYQLGRLEGAEGAFREALTVSPETPKAWKKMGDVYVNQGRFDEGLDAYENAARIRPGFAAARNALGGLWAYHFRDLEKARTELEIAVTLEPNFTLALHNLGNVHVLLGDDSGALDFFQRAVTVDPRFAAAHGSLATIYEKRGEREKAIFYLNRLLTLEPGNEDALTLLGRLNE